MNQYVILVVISLFNLGCIQGRDVTKNQNSDFLLHESGFPPLGPRKDKDQTNTATSKLPNPYIDNFPALKPSPNAPKGFETSLNSGKRDYVAPQRPTSKPSSTAGQTPQPAPSTKPTGLRDYVAPSKPQPSAPPAGGVKPNLNSFDFPPLNPSATTPKTSTSRRDYVAPNGPGLPHSTPAQPTAKPSTPPSTKLPSFSSIVSDPNKKGTSGPSNPTTMKSVVPTVVPHPNSPTKKPGSTILPSSIVNSNVNKNNANGPLDNELMTLSEELLRKDSNNAAKFITVNIQEKTTSFSKEDKAPQPLLSVPNNVWNIPTIQKFIPLLDNYEWDTLINEYITPQERVEENAFMDVVMATTVMRHLMAFLKDKGYVTPDPKQQRDFVKQLWFTLYSRGKGKIGSSGFEHVFVSELKNNEVSGLHNWIYFAREESANRVNYLGYMKHFSLNDKGALLKMHFTQRGTDKPVDTMFIGTSPELEMALYTLCFVTRPDKDCNLKLAGKDVNIVTHTFRYRSKNLIGSGYPQF